MQTSYSRYMDRAFAGMLADSGLNDVLSYFNAEASASLPFGIAVAKHAAADDAAGLLADGATAAAVIGITVHHHVTEQQLLQGVTPEDAGIPPKSPMPVLKRGRINVKVEEAVTPASPVYVRHTAGVGEQKGAFRASADGGDAVQLTTGFRFLTSAGAGEMAVLEVNLP